jgi:hypothetical protein
MRDERVMDADTALGDGGMVGAGQADPEMIRNDLQAASSSSRK